MSKKLTKEEQDLIEKYLEKNNEQDVSELKDELYTPFSIDFNDITYLGPYIPYKMDNEDYVDGTKKAFVIVTKSGISLEIPEKTYIKMVELDEEIIEEDEELKIN